MHRISRAALTALLIALPFGVRAAEAPAPNDDPFAWLEELRGERALGWVEDQNTKTNAAITSDPRYAAVYKDIFALASADDKIPYPGYYRGRIDATLTDADHVRGVWVRTTLESYRTDHPKWETILDVDKLAADEGVNWIYNSGSCLAPDYDLCLLEFSPDGGDRIQVREFDVRTRSFIKDGFQVPVGDTYLTYVDKDTVLIATDQEGGDATADGHARTIREWKRGTKLADAKTVFEVGTDDQSAWPYVWESADGSYVTVTRQASFYEADRYFLMPGGSLMQIHIPSDADVYDVFKGQMLFRIASDWEAPDSKTYPQGSLLSFSIDDYLKSGEIAKLSTVFTPSERITLGAVASTRSRVFYTVLDNVRSRAYSIGFENGAWSGPTAIALPENGTISIVDYDYTSDYIAFSYEDFLTPDSLIWSFDNGVTLERVKSLPARFPAEPYEIKQFEAPSKDGTLIPYFWIGPKDMKGPVPTILYGYGGFEDAQIPFYWASMGRHWLAHGNAFVISNIRGGGEFGPAWHEAAIKTERQRAYDDFEGIAEKLIADGLTTPKQLGIMGGSNGGLLVGVAMTQRPDLFGAVVCENPLLDMIRYVDLPPGAQWVDEYGDPAVPEERAALLAYSPYQNVKDGVTYPPVLFTTSTADDRVHPAHARKMAALMQSKNQNVLFLEDTEGGHAGQDNEALAALTAKAYLFLMQHLEAPPQ